MKWYKLLSIYRRPYSGGNQMVMYSNSIDFLKGKASELEKNYGFVWRIKVDKTYHDKIYWESNSCPYEHDDSPDCFTYYRIEETDTEIEYVEEENNG